MPLVSWLRESARIPRPPALPRALAKDPAHARRFVLATMADLAAVGVTGWAAAELTAISWLETACGTSAAHAANNVAGLKVKRDVAQWHERETGKPLAFFEAPGHTNSGDGARVLYCAFSARVVCWRVLCARVFGPNRWMRQYREASRRLRASDPTWIDALLVEGGYRGPVTAANPTDSIAEHHALAAKVRRILAAG